MTQGIAKDSVIAVRVSSQQKALVEAMAASERSTVSKMVGSLLMPALQARLHDNLQRQAVDDEHE